MSPDIVKSATEMITSMKPEELQKVLQVTSSLSAQGPDGTRLGSKFPEMTPDMVKMASDGISKMSPEELQKMLKAAASLNVNGEHFPTPTTEDRAQRSESVLQSSVAAGSSSMRESNAGSNAYNEILNSKIGQASSSIPTSTADLQESMRNSMNDPAVRQVWCLYKVSASSFISFIPQACDQASIPKNSVIILLRLSIGRCLLL